MPQQLRAGARDPPDAVQRMGHKPFDMVTVQLTPQDAVTVPPHCPRPWDPDVLAQWVQRAGVPLHILPAPWAMDLTWSIPEVKVTFFPITPSSL